MLTEKEKLEEELKLLRESLELNVITKEEFESVKQRIEAKLNKPDTLEQKKEETKVEEEVKEEPKPEDKKEEEKIEIEGVELKTAEEKEQIKEEPVKEEVKRGEEESAKKTEAGEQKKIEEVKEEAEEKATEEKPAEEAEEEKPPESIFEEEKKTNKKIFAYIAIILILGFVSGYFFFSGNSDSTGDSVNRPINKDLGLIACSSDDDCVKEGCIGICNNPGEENAECEYIKDVEVKLVVLNDKNCFNCDTGRILSILNAFFPNIEMENVDFEAEEGREFAENFDITALPAYMFNSSLSETHNYYKLFNAFDKVDSGYVMKNTVANSNYYIEREETPNKLDLFVKQDQTASAKAEENLQEFLEAFNGKVNFETHNADAQIVRELGINTFPAFLVNNKIKFGGVQSADKVKDNFCRMNELDECSLELAKSLV